MKLLLLLATLGCQRSMQEAEAALPAVGAVLPSFSLNLLDDRRITQVDLLGEPGVIALWSTTCGASRAALAGIAALHRDYADRGLHVLVLADDSSADVVRAVLDSAGLDVPVALAAGQLDALFATSKRWPWQKGVALPSFLVVDGSGVVRRRVVGVERDPAARMRRVRQAVTEVMP